jgi:hypothetical protein
MESLSKAQQRHFHSKGYLILEHFLDIAEVECILHDLEDVLSEEYSGKDDQSILVKKKGCILEPMNLTKVKSNVNSDDIRSNQVEYLLPKKYVNIYVVRYAKSRRKFLPRTSDRVISILFGRKIQSVLSNLLPKPNLYLVRSCLL